MYMTNHTLEEKESFTVLGLGIELKSHYTDFAGLNKEKAAFWQSIQQDGRLEALKKIAENNYVFAVNEAVNNKMMHYAGVITKAQQTENARVIPFPKGEYLVVKDSANSAGELENKLTGIAFGQVLSQEKNFAYVGGPNTMVVTHHKDGLVFGEMWIPVVRK